jgi:hypothetical protein
MPADLSLSAADRALPEIVFKDFARDAFADGSDFVADAIFVSASGIVGFEATDWGATASSCCPDGEFE